MLYLIINHINDYVVFRKCAFASTYIIYRNIDLAVDFHYGGRYCSGVMSLRNRRSATWMVSDVYTSFNIVIDMINDQIQHMFDFHYGCRFRLRIVSLVNNQWRSNFQQEIITQIKFTTKNSTILNFGVI
jgi:hypothetical protein